MTIDTAKLRELAQAATPGPWEMVSIICDDGGAVANYISCATDGIGVVSGNNADNNAAYITAAHPAAVLALLDENARLRGFVKLVLSGLTSRHIRAQPILDTSGAGAEMRTISLEQAARAALSGGAR